MPDEIAFRIEEPQRGEDRGGVKFELYSIPDSRERSQACRSPVSLPPASDAMPPSVPWKVFPSLRSMRNSRKETRPTTIAVAA